MIVEALSKPELLALLACAKAARKRDWLMILVGYWHGLRASEVVGLTAASIADGCVTVARLKGSMKTTQPLPEHIDHNIESVVALKKREWEQLRLARPREPG